MPASTASFALTGWLALLRCFGLAVPAAAPRSPTAAATELRLDRQVPLCSGCTRADRHCPQMHRCSAPAECSQDGEHNKRLLTLRSYTAGQQRCWLRASCMLPSERLPKHTNYVPEDIASQTLFRRSSRSVVCGKVLTRERLHASPAHVKGLQAEGSGGAWPLSYLLRGCVPVVPPFACCLCGATTELLDRPISGSH